MAEKDEEVVREAVYARRQALKRFGVAGAALAAGPAFLAACGDDDDDDSAATTAGGATTTAGSAATTGGGAATTAGGAAGDVGTQLKALLKVDEKNAGAGRTFKMGAVLALTGPGSFYGKTMSRGIDLAVKHIKAAGGPDIQVKYYDHKSGDAAAGKQAITELGENKYPAKLASYADDIGVMLEGTAQYKVFTLDGGGGAPPWAQGKPYFWGTRAITPNDAVPGLLKYIKDAIPAAKTVGLCGWDGGEPANSVSKEDILKKVADGGFTHNGLYELVPIGNQDFSQVLPKIKANEPDVLLLGLWGQDPGSFHNQAATAGLKATMIYVEFTPDGVNASKGSYEKGFTFAYDYFDPANPTNPLTKLFVDEFKNEYGEAPDFYAGNFYENTLAMWEVIRRVLAKGGNPDDGEQLDKAFQENLTVPSVYGGDATTVGTYTVDPTTHTVVKRGMGVFEYKAGKVTPKAFFDIGGADYRKV